MEKERHKQEEKKKQREKSSCCCYNVDHVDHVDGGGKIDFSERVQLIAVALSATRFPS